VSCATKSWLPAPLPEQSSACVLAVNTVDMGVTNKLFPSIVNVICASCCVAFFIIPVLATVS